MDLSIQHQQQVESYVRDVVKALQAERLAAETVDSLSNMVREQIYETVAQRAGDGASGDTVIADVLAEMPSAGDFAAEAAGAVGAKRERRRLSSLERWGMLISLLMTVGVLLACTEGAVFSLDAVFSPDESQQPATATSTPTSESVTATHPPAGARHAEGEFADDSGPALAFMLVLLLGLLVIAVCLLLVAGLIAAVIFGVGLALLGCGLATLNGLVSYRKRSWRTFLRLSVWELAILGGGLCGILVGGVIWALTDGMPWRLFGYGGLGIGVTVGAIGGVLAITILDWIVRVIIRHKQRHLPSLRLAVLGRMESVVAGAKKL